MQTIDCPYCGEPEAKVTVTVIDDDSPVYYFTKCRNPVCTAYDFMGNGWNDEMSFVKKDAYKAWVIEEKLLPVPI